MPAPATAIPFVRRDARRGMFWLRRAYAMFRAAPLPWLLLLLVYYALVALAELGPWPSIGKLAASVLKPVFAVGFLAAAWSQERGGRPALSDLFRGFRSNLRALLPLGVALYTRRPYARLWPFLEGCSPGEIAYAIALVPAIRLVGDVAKMLGYPVGVWWRLRHKRLWTSRSSS